MNNYTNIIKGRFFTGLPYMVFFAGLFTWFAFFGDYILFFQEKSSLFIFSREYMLEKSGRPGGVLVILAGLLTSFYYYPVSGAAVVSGVITLIVFATSLCVYKLSGRNEKIYPFAFGLLLFILHTDYTFFLYNSLGILLQVLFFYLSVRTIQHLQSWISLIIIPFIYLLSGGFCWIYIILLTSYFLAFRIRFSMVRIVSAWVMIFLTYLVSKNFLFFEIEETLLFYPVSLPDARLTTMIFMIVTGLVIMIPLFAKARFPVPNFLRLTHSSESIIRSVAVLSVIVMIGVYQYDKKINGYFHVEKLFYECRYDEIIDYNTRRPSTNSLTLFYNNIALAEKEMLNDRLFRFLQSGDGKTLFLKWEMVTEILKRGGYFYYTIGMINEAHRWAFENMVMTGHTPEGLKMLIKTELINGNYNMASKYISLLKKTVFYKKDALRFEKLLFNDTAVESDQKLGPKRRTCIKADFFSITDDPAVNLEIILLSDSLNRMTFDYKIAYLLLKKDYRGIADNLNRFERLGYRSFPSHIEEALLAISAMNDGISPYHGNLKVSRVTEEKWTQFLTVFQQHGNDPRAAEPALRKQFGDTFWYWAFYK